MIGLLLVLALAAPNPALTPGVTRNLTVAQVCATKWGLDRRFVSERMKRHVAEAYGVAWANRTAYEFDHLIPRELGGADDVLNIWTQPWADARVKDRRENQLHVAVCKGQVSLQAAQREMRQWGR